MNRNWGDAIADISKRIGTGALDAVKVTGKAIYDHPGEAATAVGIVAFAATGIPEAAAGGVAAGLGIAAAVRSIGKRDVGGAILDVAALVPGVRAVTKCVKAILATKDAGRLAGLAKTATQAADDAVRSGAAVKAGGYNPHSVEASHLQGVSERSATEAHRLERQVRRLNQIGISIGGVSAARTNVPKLGLEYPPLTAPPGLLMRPPVSLAPAQ